MMDPEECIEGRTNNQIGSKKGRGQKEIDGKHKKDKNRCRRAAHAKKKF